MDTRPAEPEKPEQPEAGMRKSLTNSDVVLEKLENGQYLSASEERLADLLVFHKTGKHLDKFKDPTPGRPVYTIPTIGKDKSFTATTQPPEAARPVEPPKKPKVPMAGDLPLGNPSIASGVSVAAPQNVS